MCQFSVRSDIHKSPELGIWFVKPFRAYLEIDLATLLLKSRLKKLANIQSDKLKKSFCGNPHY
jgi:hypothetical protein